MDNFWVLVLIGVLGLGGAVFTWLLLAASDRGMDGEDAEKYAELQNMENWKA
jgi:hypothetical protein